MYCSKCGKEISDQAKFCNYCGTQVNTRQPQPEKKPVEQTAPQPSAPVQTVKPKKKGKAGKRILSILVAVIVYLVVRYAAESFLTGKSNPTDIANSVKQFAGITSDVEHAMGSCSRGVIYENGYARYGMTRLYMPGYELLPGEGQDRDWLTCHDRSILFAAQKQNEIMDVSFNASDKQGMFKSYSQEYGDAEMIDFRKYEVNGFPVIRCIVAFTSQGIRQYQGELVVFPSETTNETIRLNMFVNADAGYGANDINQVFDTLEVSPEFRVTENDTNVIGFDSITVKGGNTPAKQAASEPVSQSAPVQANAGPQWSDAEIQAAVDSCKNGAIYENGSLRYGITKLDIPGYKLDSLEEISLDRLYTAGGALRVSPNHHLLMAPFEECDLEDLSDITWYPPESITYEKYYVDGFPVIRCYVYDESYHLFIGKLIVYPHKTSKVAVGFSMTADAAEGYDYTDIYEVFDTLQVSPEYMVTGTNVGDFGTQRITVR